MPYVDLTDIKKIPLNGLEILQLNPNTTLMKYTDLYQFDNIHDAFLGNKKLVLLYLLQNESMGHYVALFYNKNGLNYFDSYGVLPDYQFELLTPAKRKQLHEEQDYLKQLIHNEPLIYNNITYQDKGTATCGCFCSHRLHHKALDDNEYLELFLKQNKTPDEVVSKWCFSKL